MENIKYTCKICGKDYASASSLSNHKKIYHTTNEKQDIKRNKNEEDNLYHCRYCSKKYKNHRSRWKHEIKCTLQNNKDNEKIKDKIIDELNHTVEELKTQLYKTKKLKTFHSINKRLKEISYMKNSQNTINSNNAINNTITNNAITNHITQIFNIGAEDLPNVLSIQEKKQILNSRYNALEKIVEIAHCGQYTQFKNIVITNIKDDFAYKYDEEKGYFITGNKNEILDELFDCRKTDIEHMYVELDSTNKIDEKTKRIIKTFLEKCDCEDQYIDDTNTKYPNYKSYKINKFKIILYNNAEKNTQDIEFRFT